LNLDVNRFFSYGNPRIESNMSKPLKIIVCGPSHAGKSTISNFLADQTNGLELSDYRPTVACRFGHLES